MTVTHGTTATWRNDDSAGHIITSGKVTDSNPGSLFDSGLVTPGETFHFTFTNVGTFDYFDPLFPWMTSKVIVN
jgi:plastocyanin